MLKKSASGVLASLRGSTYRSIRLASSLAAALLDGHFEHPAGHTAVTTIPLETERFQPQGHSESSSALGHTLGSHIVLRWPHRQAPIRPSATGPVHRPRQRRD